MSKSLRLLALAAVFNIVVGGAAAAQTVLVKGAKPGEGLEVVINAAPPAVGTIGPDGTGTVVAQLPLNAQNEPEMDARVYVDSCDKRRRVTIIERNQQVAVREQGCERREIGGVFWVRQRSTVVIDVAGPIPTLLLRQGEYDPTAVGATRDVPRGLVVFVGGGWGALDDITATACGNVGECEGKTSGGAYTAGATFWLTRFLAVEGSYMKPRTASYEGNGLNFRFDHSLETEIFTAGGKLAVPIRAVRLYGMGGGAFHRATSRTTQTNDPLSYTSEGVTYSVPGGTQTFEWKTEGWSWLTGGGIEGWVSPRVALYAEGVFVKIKGEPTSGTDVPVDTKFISAFAGIRLKLF